MVLLGSCNRTIYARQQPETAQFRLRKPLPADPTSFGERFRAARVAGGHTQTEMARKFGVSLSTIKFWEQSRTQPNPTVRYHVEVFLKSPPETTAQSAQQPDAAQPLNRVDLPHDS